ncbi:MAG: hypothetical protein KBT82_13305 [Marinobacter sp.]|uniref:hypothetical protein n=1 Tax=Marinobacter sp. TaxID=50741 RepID=UPI001B77EB80|nr:hypothetical protein [Marinobacter sp.]MBQ0748132.1 hypothetical protein [Marinobacter sp.]MBQ0815129.1 hypothetical protein [Marinobacter sp.]
MTRFTLNNRRWYAMELFSPEFGEQVRCCSPIMVYELTPMGGGGRRFELSFHHEVYPEGVQDKGYTIQTIERSDHYLLGRVVESDRLVLFLKLTSNWLYQHFDDRAVAAFLDKNNLTKDFA